MDNVFVFFLIMALALGMLVGTINANIAWQNDCREINAHVAMNGQVFRCELVKPEPK